MDDGPSTSTASTDEWVSLLERKRTYYTLVRQTVRPIHHCLICRVPQKILELDRNAYIPISLSIGPYHHGNPNLKLLEEKWRCLDYILRLNPEKGLQDYLQLIEGLEQKARSCYPEEFVMESDEFIKMLLLDGSFVLVGIRGIQGNFISQNKLLDEQAYLAEGSDNSVQTGKWPNSFIFHDIFLLENQIPFFVIKEIYELFGGKSESSKLADRIGEYLEYLLAHAIPYRGTCRPNAFHHLLHFWHMYLSPTEDREEQQEHHQRLPLFPYFSETYEKLNTRNMPNKSKIEKKIQSSRFIESGRRLLRWRQAEQYHEAGVHFQKRVFTEHDPHGQLDIKFTNGLLEIPTLFIDGNTGSFFRNIIALEQTCPQYGNYVTSYCAFLSQLVSNPADVTLLAKRGILVHHMSTDQEVSALLTKLGKNVDFDINGFHYLNSICRRMEEHYESRMNRWMAWLWHNHFSNPWLALAVLAAAIILLCTILQTLFTFLAYFNPIET